MHQMLLSSMLLVALYQNCLSTAQSTNTFGSAKLFQPIPGISVRAHCKWEPRITTVSNRIPQTLTEIVCHDEGDTCGGHTGFSCRQIHGRLPVAYTEHDEHDAFTWPYLYKRNITFGIGCACVSFS